MATMKSADKKQPLYSKEDIRGFKIFMAFFVFFMALAVVLRIWDIEKNKFDYGAHLDDIILTVEYTGVSKTEASDVSSDGTETTSITVTLRQYGCYIFEVEGLIQRQALIYDSDDPTLYWNTHLSAGMESSFMTVYAAEAAIGGCLQDTVYYMTALNEDFSLDSDEEKKALENAKIFFKGMSDTQKEKLGVSEDAVLEMRYRAELAEAYALNYAAEHDVTGYGGTPAEVMSYDGNYFKEIILPNFKVTYNDDILDKIEMGKITVNMEETDK